MNLMNEIFPKDVWNKIIWKFDDPNTCHQFQCVSHKAHELIGNNQATMKQKFSTISKLENSLEQLSQFLGKHPFADIYFNIMKGHIEKVISVTNLKWNPNNLKEIKIEIKIKK